MDMKKNIKFILTIRPFLKFGTCYDFEIGLTLSAQPRNKLEFAQSKNGEDLYYSRNWIDIYIELRIVYLVVKTGFKFGNYPKKIKRDKNKEIEYIDFDN